MKKRWLSLYVENEIGVLARISGLFAGKAYNLESLTVGVTEDKTISRMTISLNGDDKIFEQIKKQLNRSIEVIKVSDYTDIPIHSAEILFMKLNILCIEDKTELFRLAKSIPQLRIIDFDGKTAILQCVLFEEKNNHIIEVMQKLFNNRFEIVRGGSVAIEAVSKTSPQ